MLLVLMACLSASAAVAPPMIGSKLGSSNLLALRGGAKAVEKDNLVTSVFNMINDIPLVYKAVLVYAYLNKDSLQGKLKK